MQANKQKKNSFFLFIMNYSPCYVYRERYKADILNIMFLNVLTETLTNGYKVEFLFVLSLTCIFLGISIIITKNPILSVLFLIALFFSVSLYLMLIGLYFMGLSYLLVYVGAISILFLFILMLINVRISELLTEGKNSIPLAIIAVLAFNFSVNRALPYSVSALDIISNNILSINRFIQSKIFSDETINVNKTVLNYTVDWVNPLEIANVKSKSWDTILVENTHITSIGNILYTSLFILLIVTSLILLLAMVGTIVITIKKSKQNSISNDNMETAKYSNISAL